MTWYLGRATTKLVKLPRGLHYPSEDGELITQERGEFAVERQLKALGIDARAPQKIELKRLGKKRTAEPIVSPYLPGYFFAEIPADLFFAAQEAKGMARGLMTIPAAEVRMHVLRFLERVEQENADARRFIEAKDKAAMCQFTAGEALEILTGPFMERLVKFERMYQGANDLHPMIEASMQMMGQEVKVSLDPLDVRGAA